MSKLYNKYLTLKEKYPKEFLLFNNGLFYIFLDQDAKIVSEKIGLKLTNLNNSVVKCGFPVDKISKYGELLSNNDINFKIIENDFTIIKDTPNYINNDIIKTFINTVNSTDLDSTSPLEALNLLVTFKENVRNIKNAYTN